MCFFKKCKHEYEKLGIFYKERLTQYKNCFDTVNIYRKEKCKKCGEIHDVLLSSESFTPELYDGRDSRKDEYIKHIEEKGIKLEIDLQFLKIQDI